MKKIKITTTYEELIKNHYGDNGLIRLRSIADVDDLITNYYGKVPEIVGKSDAPSKPAVILSLSIDDGEVVNQGKQYEEYLVQQAPQEPNFTEYVIATVPTDYPLDNTGSLSTQSSLTLLDDAPSGDEANVFEEYRLDVLQPLNSYDRSQTQSPSFGQSTDDKSTAPTLTPASTTDQQKGSSTTVATIIPTNSSAINGVNAPVSSPPGSQTQPSLTDQVTDDDFLADIKAILAGEKELNQLQDGSAIKENPVSQLIPSSVRPAESQPESNPEQAIFDRIAKSMQYANAYDLGSVELENRFAAFDRDADQQEQDSPRLTLTTNGSNGDHTASHKVGTEDFLRDLNDIRQQALENAGVEMVPAATPESLVLSRPMFDTGEHVLLAGDLFPDRLHVGTGSGVAFSYGHIIAMGDLYESADQMIHADVKELQELKTLINRSTAFYQGNKTNHALDVSNEEWEAATHGRYLSLAQNNYEHFSPNIILKNSQFVSLPRQHPDHKSMWETYHRQAIEDAQAIAVNPRSANQSIFLEQPLITNAFGDHFLTDAFAAGHMINKEEMIYLFRANFYNGSDLKPEAKAFFGRVAKKAFVGDVKKKFSVLETYDTYVNLWIIHLWHPNIDSVDRFQSLLETAAEQQPEAVANVVVKALHDRLNKDGIDVFNNVGEAWTATGDMYLQTRDHRVMNVIKRAVQQSVDNINDPSILQSNLNFEPYFRKVWDHVPQLTEASQRKVQTLLMEYTDPTSVVLSDMAAAIITSQVNSLIKKLKAEKKLRDA